MVQGPSSESGERATKTRLAEVDQKKVEQEIRERALEIARLLSRLSEPIRSMAAHDAMHAIREVAAEQPDLPLTPSERPVQNFGVFGLLLAIAGLVMTIIYRGFGFVGAMFIIVGTAIFVIWLVAWLVARGRRGTRHTGLKP